MTRERTVLVKRVWLRNSSVAASSEAARCNEGTSGEESCRYASFSYELDDCRDGNRLAVSGEARCAINLAGTASDCALGVGAGFSRYIEDSGPMVS